MTANVTSLPQLAGLHNPQHRHAFLAANSESRVKRRRTRTVPSGMRAAAGRPCRLPLGDADLERIAGPGRDC